ncbi:MAG: hypothetical protein HOC79_05745 [Euryarchaeota archaeon]|jgi:hypothetical protein|nr:hypothetical protein [Euryarchaeota archaeon]
MTQENKTELKKQQSNEIECNICKAKDSIVSVEEAVSQFRISVVDGEIQYDGTSEKMIHSEVVDYQCVECNTSFTEGSVKDMNKKESEINE